MANRTNIPQTPEEANAQMSALGGVKPPPRIAPTLQAPPWMTNNTSALGGVPSPTSALSAPPWTKPMPSPAPTPAAAPLSAPPWTKPTPLPTTPPPLPTTPPPIPTPAVAPHAPHVPVPPAAPAPSMSVADMLAQLSQGVGAGETRVASGVPPAAPHAPTSTLGAAPAAPQSADDIFKTLNAQLGAKEQTLNMNQKQAGTPTRIAGNLRPDGLSPSAAQARRAAGINPTGAASRSGIPMPDIAPANTTNWEGLKGRELRKAQKEAQAQFEKSSVATPSSQNKGFDPLPAGNRAIDTTEYNARTPNYKENARVSGREAGLGGAKAPLKDVPSVAAEDAVSKAKASTLKNAANTGGLGMAAMKGGLTLYSGLKHFQGAMNDLDLLAADPKINQAYKDVVGETLGLNRPYLEHLKPLAAYSMSHIAPSMETGTALMNGLKGAWNSDGITDIPHAFAAGLTKPVKSYHDQYMDAAKYLAGEISDPNKIPAMPVETPPPAPAPTQAGVPQPGVPQAQNLQQAGVLPQQSPVVPPGVQQSPMQAHGTAQPAAPATASDVIPPDQRMTIGAHVYDLRNYNALANGIYQNKAAPNDFIGVGSPNTRSTTPAYVDNSAGSASSEFDQQTKSINARYDAAMQAVKSKGLGPRDTTDALIRLEDNRDRALGEVGKNQTTARVAEASRLSSAGSRGMSDAQAQNMMFDNQLSLAKYQNELSKQQRDQLMEGRKNTDAMLNTLAGNDPATLKKYQQIFNSMPTDLQNRVMNSDPGEQQAFLQVVPQLSSVMDKTNASSDHDLSQGVVGALLGVLASPGTRRVGKGIDSILAAIPRTSAFGKKHIIERVLGSKLLTGGLGAVGNAAYMGGQKTTGLDLPVYDPKTDTMATGTRNIIDPAAMSKDFLGNIGHATGAWSPYRTANGVNISPTQDELNAMRTYNRILLQGSGQQ